MYVGREYIWGQLKKTLKDKKEEEVFKNDTVFTF